MIVGVHGIGHHRAGWQPAEVARHLSEEWSGHLGSDVSVAYYAHRLRDAGRQGEEGLTPEAEAMLRAWLDQWELNLGTRQGIGSLPIRQGLGILAEFLGLAAPDLVLFAVSFFREVQAYLRADAPHRTLAQLDVANAVAAAAKPVTVIAHSLGSVVAYEALHRYGLEVDLLVTLGSPLALPVAVFPRLDPLPANGFGTRPPGVRRWVNLADKGDLVAIPRGGVASRFRDVENHPEVSVHWLDFHTAGGYLRTSELGALLRV